MDAAEKGRKDIVKWQLNSSLANNDDVGEKDFLITRRLAYLQESNRYRMEILRHPLFLAPVLRRGVVVFRGTEVDDGRYADHPRGRRLRKIRQTIKCMKKTVVYSRNLL